MNPPALARGAFDRAADRRRDAPWLAARRADPASRLLLVDDTGRAAVDDGPDGPRLVLVAAAEAPGDDLLFLGLDGDGRAYFAATGPPPRRLDQRLAGLREVGAELGDRDAHLFTTAVALTNWHRTHPRCPRCGAPTRMEAAGYTRRCETDGSEHFPRTDPAVIMVVTDGADRCVLGRQPSWPPGRYSTLAGFVEPGESLEQAVRREVREEVGLTVRAVGYVASQPWPFPSSLMLGFTAVAEPGDPVVADGELEDAAWFDREDIRTGRVLLPGPISIARRLIDGWLDAPAAG